MFSCEFCKIFNNIYFEEHLEATASVFYLHMYLEISRRSYLKWIFLSMSHTEGNEITEESVC